jgi:hypothetical protein
MVWVSELGNEMAALEDPTQLPANSDAPALYDPTQPVAPVPMQSRAVTMPSLPSPYAPEGSADSFTRGMRSATVGMGTGAMRLWGLGKIAAGDQEGGMQTLQNAAAQEKQYEAEGPAISSIKDVHSVSDVGSYVAGLAGQAVPTLASMLIPGGIAAKIGRSAVERGAAKAATELGAKAAADAIAGGATKEAAATVAMDTAAAAAKTALPATAKAAATANTIGEAAGATVGGLPTTAGTTDLTPQELADNPGKYALGTLAASAAGALPAARLLERSGAGKAAGEGVSKAAEAVMPRIAKEVVKQGLAGSAGSIAQTAAELATHKWIDNNIDMLSPQAFDSYLNSGIAGGMIGGLTGGLLESAKGIKAPNLGLPDAAAKLRQTVRDFRADRAAKMAEPIAGGPDKAAPAATPEAPVDVAATHEASMAAVKPGPEGISVAEEPGVSGSDLKPEGAETQAPATETTDKFGAFMSKQSDMMEESGHSDEDLDGIIKGAQDAHAADQQSTEPVVGVAPRRSNPIQFDDKIQNMLAAHIPLDHTLWNDPDKLKPMVESVSHLFDGGDLSKQDHQHITDMSDIVGGDTMMQWVMGGRDYGELGKLADRMKVGEGGELDKAALTDPANTTVDKIAASVPGSQEHADLQTQARNELKTKKQLLTQRWSTPEARKFWAAKTKDPTNWVITNSDDKGGGQQRVAIQNLVSERLNGPAANTGETPHQALTHVLSDLKMSNIHVDPASVKPGEFYSSKDKTTTGTLSPRQAAAIRGELQQHGMMPARDQAISALRQHNENTKAEAKRAVNKQEIQDNPMEMEAERKEQATAKRAKAHENVAGDASFDQAGGPNADQGKLVPRQRAPEVMSEKADEGKPLTNKRQQLDAEAGVKQAYQKTLDKPNKFATNADMHQAITDAAAAKPPVKAKPEAQMTPKERGAYHEAVAKYAKQERLAYKARAASDVLGPDHAISKAVEEVPEGSMKPEITPHEPVTQKSEESTADDIIKRNAGATTAKSEAKPPGSRSEANMRREKGRAATRAAAAAKEETQAQARNDSDQDIHDGLSESEKPTGHQYGKETKTANALLDRIKFKGPALTIKPPPKGSGITGGRYEPSTNTAYIADHLHGPERIEVLAHEIAHHVILHELGEQFEKASPELRDALMKDYTDWLTKQNQKGNTYAEVRASRAAPNRGDAILAKEGNYVRLDQMEPESVKDLLDKHEWLADNFARALTQKGEAQGIIGKLFSGIAQKLRDLYDGFSGAEKGKYAPAKSVDTWVKSLFDRNTNDVREALGQGVPRETAKDSITAAVHAAHGGGDDAAPPEGGGGSGPGSENGNASAGSITDEAAYKAYDRFSKFVLTPELRGIVERALYRRPVMDQILAQYGHDQKLMNDLETPGKDLQALSFIVNRMLGKGTIDLSPHLTEPWLKMREAALKVFGIAGNNEMALKILTDIRNGEIARAEKGSSGRTRYSVQSKFADRGQVQRSFNTAVTLMRDNVYAPWRRLLYGPTDNAHLAYTPALNEIQSLLKTGIGARGEDHGISQSIMRQRERYNTRASVAFEGLNEAQRTTALQHMQQHTTPDDPAIKGAMDKVYAMFKRAANFAKDSGVDLHIKGGNHFPVVMDGGDVINRAAEFKAWMSDPKWEGGLRSVLHDSESDQAGLVDKLYDYASGNKRPPPEGYQRDPTSAPNFTAMNHRLMQFVYDKGTPEDFKKFASFQAKHVNDVITPYMEGLIKRSEFARRFGDDGSKLQALIAQARRQGATKEDIQFTMDSVGGHTGAYAADGSPFVRKVVGAVATKFSTDDPYGTENFKTAAEKGAAIGKKAGGFFADPKTKAGISIAMAVQNIRVLPLALLSSVADPMGIGVRYGGIKSMKDLSQAWKSFKDGFVANHSKMDKTGLQGQADIIGRATEYFVSSLLSEGNSPGLEGLARRASDFTFKANGMTSFVKSTYFMAQSAANAFLLKHKANGDPKNSARYLSELGVKPEDIHTGANGLVKVLNDAEHDAATPAEQAANKRVIEGLSRFIDQAILRTDSAQHPHFMNDPAFRLITQYKQFGYAFSDQILDRIAHELHYSNFHVLGPVMGYIPITILAEMTRGLIQYGPGGNPQRDGWGPFDYFLFAGERAGLTGPRIQLATNLGSKMMGESNAYVGMQHSAMGDLGPTAQQLGDIGKSVLGERAWSKTLIESGPASPLYSHHWSL